MKLSLAQITAILAGSAVALPTLKPRFVEDVDLVVRSDGALDAFPLDDAVFAKREAMPMPVTPKKTKKTDKKSSYTTEGTGEEKKDGDSYRGGKVALIPSYTQDGKRIDLNNDVQTFGAAVGITPEEATKNTKKEADKARTNRGINKFGEPEAEDVGPAMLRGTGQPGSEDIGGLTSSGPSREKQSIQGGAQPGKKIQPGEKVIPRFDTNPNKFPNTQQGRSDLQDARDANRAISPDGGITRGDNSQTAGIVNDFRNKYDDPVRAKPGRNQGFEEVPRQQGTYDSDPESD